MDHTTEARGGENWTGACQPQRFESDAQNNWGPHGRPPLLQLVAAMAADVGCATAGKGAGCCPRHGGWWRAAWWKCMWQRIKNRKGERGGVHFL